MPGLAWSADSLKMLTSAVLTVVTAGIVAFGAWLARWKIQTLSHEELVRTIAEQRTYIEEKERLLVALREELEKVQRVCAEHGKRQDELDAQILEQVRWRHIRERWTRKVVLLCEGAGVLLPPWEDP